MKRTSTLTLPVADVETLRRLGSETAEIARLAVHALTLRCADAWARDLEQTLRRTLYQWRHMPADMIVSPYIECPLAIDSTGLGVKEDVDVARTDESNPVVSRHFHIQSATRS